MDGVEVGGAGEWARAGFGAFFAEQRREVGLLAQRLCGKRDVAEEIAADAFAEAWRRWEELTAAGAPAAAMGGIVERLVHERADRAARRSRAPQGGAAIAAAGGQGEPDGERVRALLAERLALIPPQDAPTVVIAKIVEAGPADADARRAGLAAKLRRPAPIAAGAIVAVALVAAGAIAMSGSGGGPAPADHQALQVADTGAAGDSAGDSASPSVSAASPSASASASATATASASASPSASPSASAKPSAPASSSAATASSTPTTTLLTASASADYQDKNSTWTELDVTTSIKQPLSALTITITVADCDGLSARGSWDSGAGGAFSTTTTTNADGSITYVFQLKSGHEVDQGSIDFAAQFTHQSQAWKASADSYSIVAQAAGSSATANLTGSF